MPNGSPVIVGQNNPPNTGTDTTTLQTSPTSAVPAFRVDNQTTGDGIYATSYDAIAVNAVGGWGSTAAVSGRNTSFYGGYFTSQDYVALLAESGTSYGVIGKGGGRQPGVSGGATNGHGVYGNSIKGYGVYGYSSTIGVVGYNPSNGYSGAFSGGRGVFVQGGLIVTGGPKSAAVPVRDGSLRSLYCVESPESWFEDFGRARLARGRASIKLDPMFAAVVRSDNYHVFISAEGECGALHVRRRGRTGFEVREQRGQSSSVTFSYRVVARRKDIDAPRFAKVTAPSVAEPVKREVLPIPGGSLRV